MRRLRALGAILLVGWSPFVIEHPEIAEGNRRLATGDHEGALRSYERAEKELGARPEIDYNRGSALYQLGRHAEAREAFQKALETPGLAARDAYNLGNTLARLDDTDGAIRAYRRSLVLDPANDDARYNLEVMIRRRSEGKRGPPPDEQRAPENPDRTPDGGTPDGGSPDGGQDGGRDRDQPDGGQEDRPDGGRDGGDQGSADQDGGRDGGNTPARERPQDGGSESKDQPQTTRAGPTEKGEAGQSSGHAAELSQQEAIQLLDAMREREKNMPMRPAQERRGKELDVAKDW